MSTVFDDLTKLELKRAETENDYLNSLNNFFESYGQLESEIITIRQKMQEAKKNNDSSYEELLTKFLMLKSNFHTKMKNAREKIKKAQACDAKAKLKISNLQQKIKCYGTFNNASELIEDIAILMSLIENKEYFCKIKLEELDTEKDGIWFNYKIFIVDDNANPVINFGTFTPKNDFDISFKINFYGNPDKNEPFDWTLDTKGFWYIKDFVNMIIIDRYNKGIQDEEKLTRDYYINLMQMFILENHQFIHQKRIARVLSEKEEDHKPPALH